MTKFTYKKYSHADMDTYFNTFNKLVNNEFPIYSPEVRDFMLNNKRAWSRENWEKYHENKYRHIYGAWADNDLVGILIGSSDYSGVAFLTWLMVDSTYQKKGAGKFLVNEFVTNMKDKGQHAVYLRCEDKNRVIYEKLGYEQVARIPEFWFGIDINMMVKRLQQPHSTPWIKE